MKKALTCLFLMSIAGCFAQQDTIFLDRSWKPCKRSSAEYYRLIRPQGTDFLLTDYYMNHTLQMEVQCSQVDTIIRNGKATFYDRQGRVLSQGMYTNNAETGIWSFTSYFNNGSKYSTGFLLKNSLLDSTLTFYYQNDKPYSTSSFANDTLHGMKTFFRDDGSVQITTDYAKGKRDGWYIEYSKSGLKRYEEEYHQGKRNGNKRIYFTSGNLQGDFHWTERRVNGYKIWYYENGEIQSKVTFLNGKRTKVVRSGRLIQ